MTDDDQIAFLMGQVHALQGAVTALAFASQNRQALAFHTDALFEVSLTNLQNADAPKQCIEGFRWASREFQRAVHAKPVGG